MGYGVPAALGVQVAHPKSTVVCVTSEGSLMMNIQEMDTIAKYQLPVKIFNLNNKVLGMIRQWQELFHNNHESECDLSGGPDFIGLAEAFGFEKADMLIDVEIGVQRPDEVDIHQVAAIFPYGNASIQVVEGGLDIAKPGGKGHTIIANAAVIVCFDMEAATGGAA